jgi:hypothetical protein
MDEVINPDYRWNVGLTILPSVLKSLPVNEGHALGTPAFYFVQRLDHRTRFVVKEVWLSTT